MNFFKALAPLAKYLGNIINILIIWMTVDKNSDAVIDGNEFTEAFVRTLPDITYMFPNLISLKDLNMIERISMAEDFITIINKYKK